MIFFNDNNIIDICKYKYNTDIDFYSAVYLAVFNEEIKTPDFTKYISKFTIKDNRNIYIYETNPKIYKKTF